MERKYIIYTAILISLFLNASNSLPQSKTSEFKCGMGKMAGCDPNPALAVNIPYMTPGQNEFLRALFIYVVFPDDTLSNFPYTIWDKPSSQFPCTKPVNPYPGTNGKIVCSEPGNKNLINNRYPDYTVSDFFCEMSGGKMDLIADEYCLRLPFTSNYYDSVLNYSVYGMNAYVLHQIDSIYNIDWTRYDNWKKTGSNWQFGVRDTVPELIVIYYRSIPHYENQWFWSNSYGGIASLLILDDIFFNNIKINCNNGITAINFRYNTTHSELILEHEICHKLFGTNLVGVDGWHTNLGMMTSSVTPSTYEMSPYERTYFPVYTPPPIIINSTGIYNLTLQDYIFTGQIAEVYINETSDFFYITNNQKKSVYDGITRGGKKCYSINLAEQDPYCPDGKGMYVWRQGTGCYNVNYPFDIVAADGKYNWAIFRYVFVPAFGFELPVFKYTGSNYINGRDLYKKAPAYPSSPYGQYIEYKECSDSLDEVDITFDLYGNNRTGFKMNYNEILSPYSNPSSNTCKNPNSTGLTVRLISEDTVSGILQVKVYYNENDSALAQCPPAKPKIPTIDKDFVEPRISFHPKLSWEPNIEPDFISSGNYKIYKGVSNNCSDVPVYTYLTSVNSGVNEFVDPGILLFVQPTGNKNNNSNKVTVSYKITAVDGSNKESVKSERGFIIGYGDTVVTHIIDSVLFPKSFELFQNVPNPFNSMTKIKYNIPFYGFVTLNIYDILGREVNMLVKEFKRPGIYYVDFNSSNLSSGIYFYKLSYNNQSKIKKLIILK